MLVICAEVFVAEFIATQCFHASSFGYTGIITMLKTPYIFFYYFFWGMVSGPLSEEFGWRGYLQDQLNKKKSMFFIYFVDWRDLGNLAFAALFLSISNSV